MCRAGGGRWSSSQPASTVRHEVHVASLLGGALTQPLSGFDQREEERGGVVSFNYDCYDSKGGASLSKVQFKFIHMFTRKYIRKFEATNLLFNTF